MKHFLSFVLVITIAVTAFGTGQFTERINDNGVDKGLASYLLELDSLSFPKIKERIPDKWFCTALWRKYIGYWKIKNDSLFLDSIITGSYDNYITVKINDIYAARRTPSGYFADWVTDTIRVVSGEVIHYVHMGWESVWEREEYVTVVNGLIKNRIVYKNRVVNPGNEREWYRKTKSLGVGDIPRRIILQIGCRGFDKNGTPTGYDIKVVRSCGDKNVDDNAIKAIQNANLIRHIIPVYYIRGQYKSYDMFVPIPKSTGPEDTSK